MRGVIVRFAFIGLMLASGAAGAQPAWLDKVDESLYLQSPGGFFRSDLSGLLDLEGYYVDQRPPGLLFGKTSFFNPRLSLFLDSHAGTHFYSLVQVRFDRGFDPHVKDHSARFDEYLLRYTPFNQPVLNVQVGKFATVFGQWVNRHDSWESPLITPPLAYENVTVVGDQAAPASVAAFLARRGLADVKTSWLPIIWGPSYASGASMFGTVQRFDYAFEVKNASLSSRPSIWDGRKLGWENPTYTGRFGVRPNEAWNVGASVSYGTYLLPKAELTLPPGKSLRNFNQTTVASDVSYSWHHWQFWGEAIASRFQVPNVGNADSISYFLESKYKITSSLFAAFRWNQQLFDDIPNGTGGRAPWDLDIWRADLAIGYRFNRHLQSKIQYSYSHQKGTFQQGEQLVAAQVTVKF